VVTFGGVNPYGKGGGVELVKKKRVYAAGPHFVLGEGGPHPGIIMKGPSESGSNLEFEGPKPPPQK